MQFFLHLVLVLRIDLAFQRFEVTENFYDKLIGIMGNKSSKQENSNFTTLTLNAKLLSFGFIKEFLLTDGPFKKQNQIEKHSSPKELSEGKDRERM